MQSASDYLNDWYRTNNSSWPSFKSLEKAGLVRGEFNSKPDIPEDWLFHQELYVRHKLSRRVFLPIGYLELKMDEPMRIGVLAVDPKDRPQFDFQAPRLNFYAPRVILSDLNITNAQAAEDLRGSFRNAFRSFLEHRLFGRVEH